MAKAKKIKPKKAAKKTIGKMPPKAQPKKTVKKKSSNGSRGKSASRILPMDIDLMDTTKSSLSSTFRNLTENENLSGHEFIITAREIPGSIAIRRPCPRGFHLEIDPETGIGKCVSDR